MAPVEFYFTKENHLKVGTDQSAKISFLDEHENEKCLVCIQGTKNGGEVTVREKKDGQTKEDHFIVEPGQMNKEHSCNETPIVIIGTSN